MTAAANTTAPQGQPSVGGGDSIDENVNNEVDDSGWVDNTIYLMNKYHSDYEHEKVRTSVKHRIYMYKPKSISTIDYQITVILCNL